MASGTINLLPVKSQTPKQINAIINGGSSITIECDTFVGVFGYASSYCAIYLCRGSFVVPIVNTGSPVTISYSSGTYTITNELSDKGLRYMIFYR